MDVLSDILGSLRLTGGVVIDGRLAGDFCLLSQFTPDHCAPFFPMPETLIGYHYVRQGRMVVQVEGHPVATVRAGEIAILPRNDPHLLASRIGLTPANVDDVAWITADGVHRIAAGQDGPVTEVWCGFLGTAKDSAHPLLDALPPLLTLDIKSAHEDWLETSLRFLAEQHPAPDVVARLSEVFLTQAVREYLQQLPSGQGGWLAGLRDPAVAKALAIIHSGYAEELDVEQIAREAGVSRSVLGERFVELLGEPPMRYCAHWRMRVAANMLREGRENTANIAYAVGFNSEAAFNRAFKREYGDPPVAWKRKLEERERAARETVQPTPLPEQTVRYCNAKDGTRLAFSLVGDGPPLVKTANWLNHIEHDFDSPLWRHWIRELTQDHCLVRYDERANGLSDWDTPDISFDAFVDDLECVVDCADLERFDLLGISQGAAVAIAYAVGHPERVRKMVLYGGYAMGWAVRDDHDERARREAMITLTEVGWGADNPAYRQLFTNLYIPGATPKQQDWFTEVQRQSASPANAVTLQRVLSRIDVRKLLPQVKVPTLVLHARDDQVIPFSAGEGLAAKIPGAIFVPLEGENHILLEHEPAWKVFRDTMRDILAGGRVPAAAATQPPPEDRIAECTAADGTRLAYAVTGSGFPLVKAPNWISHLKLDPAGPVYRHWIAECARAHQFLRSDMRGFGCSDWEPPSFDFDHILSDFETVVDDAGVEQCDLVGMAHGAAVAIAYAARHPERVRRLVLLNSFAAGWRVRADPEEVAWRTSLSDMNRREWSFRRSLFGEMFLTLYFPGAGQELIEWHNAHFEELGPVEKLEQMIEIAADMDVRDDLTKVRAPTLVCHSVKDGNAPIAAGREVAEGIAGARFVELDSANHMLLGDEPAWPVFTREMRAFLKPD